MSGATNGVLAARPQIVNSTTYGENMPNKKKVTKKVNSATSKDKALRKSGNKGPVQAVRAVTSRSRGAVSHTGPTTSPPLTPDDKELLVAITPPLPTHEAEAPGDAGLPTDEEPARDEGSTTRLGASGATDPRLPQVPTTLVRRDRHGVVQCECTVGPEGIFYKGQKYRSLSGAASAASKDLGLNSVVNGYVFFHLAKPARARMGDVERLQTMGKRYEEHLGALLARRLGAAPDDAVMQESAAHAERVARILMVCAA